MEHGDISAILPAYVDNELGIADALAVERHLVICAECRREVAEQTALSARLKTGALRIGAPEHFAKRIVAALPQRGWRDTGFWRWRFDWLRAGAVAAVLLAVVWSAVLYLGMPPAQERLADEVIASHLRSLQADHLFDVASSDQHTVKPWFNGQLNFAPPVVDLSGQEFPLMGGRLDYFAGRPVAAIVYRHNRHPLNLYIWPGADADTAPRKLYRRGFHLVRWTGGGMEYWAISDLSGEDLDRFVAALRQTTHQ